MGALCALTLHKIIIQVTYVVVNMRACVQKSSQQKKGNPPHFPAESCCCQTNSFPGRFG